MKRKMTSAEINLIAALARRAGIDIANDWLSEASVEPMDDGGMGSLLIGAVVPTGQSLMQVAELEFEDADGVKVSAALNVDRGRIPRELDIWRTDFAPLIRIPSEFES